MLEIILLIVLCKSLGKMLRAKGRSPVGYQVLLVLMWIAAEFAGAFIGGIVLAIFYGDAAEGMILWLLIPAIVGAATAAGMLFLVVHLLPDLNPVRDFESDYLDSEDRF